MSKVQGLDRYLIATKLRRNGDKSRTKKRVGFIGYHGPNFITYFICFPAVLDADHCAFHAYFCYFLNGFNDDFEDVFRVWHVHI